MCRLGARMVASLLCPRPMTSTANARAPRAREEFEMFADIDSWTQQDRRSIEQLARELVDLRWIRADPILISGFGRRRGAWLIAFSGYQTDPRTGEDHPTEELVRIAPTGERTYELYYRRSADSPPVKALEAFWMGRPIESGALPKGFRKRRRRSDLAIVATAGG